MFKKQELDLAGDCYHYLMPVAEDLHILKSSYLPFEDLEIESKAPYADKKLIMTFALQGSSSFFNHHGEDLIFNPNSCTLSAINNSSGVRCYRKNQAVKQIRLILGEKFLNNYLGETATDNIFEQQLKKIAQLPISPFAESYLKQIYWQQLNSLELHINSLLLFRHYLSLLYPQQQNSNQKISQQDIEKIDKVYQFMQNNLANKLTINQLALIAGLNTQKLKTVFKQVYGTSVHQTLIALRMQKAHHLLQQGLYVSQVAYRVGYNQPNNFTAAFKQYFGYSAKYVYKKQPS